MNKFEIWYVANGGKQSDLKQSTWGGGAAIGFHRVHGPYEICSVNLCLLAYNFQNGNNHSEEKDSSTRLAQLQRAARNDGFFEWWGRNGDAWEAELKGLDGWIMAHQVWDNALKSISPSEEGPKFPGVDIDALHKAEQAETVNPQLTVEPHTGIDASDSARWVQATHQATKPIDVKGDYRQEL